MTVDAEHAVACVKRLVDDYEALKASAEHMGKVYDRVKRGHAELDQENTRKRTIIDGLESANAALRAEVASLKSLANEQLAIIQNVRVALGSDVPLPVRGGDIGPNEPAERLAR